jgi:hypothetical protein
LNANVDDVITAKQHGRKLRLATLLDDLTRDAFEVRLFVQNWQPIET